MSDLIWHETNEHSIRASSKSEIDIVYYNKQNNTRDILNTSKAWNWQQGTMLQWLGKTNDRIIFNDFNESCKTYHSEIININTKKIKRIHKPIYSVSKTGNFALTLNFDRLTKFRPTYGYFRTSNTLLPDDTNDGIWYVDLYDNTYKLILTLDDLKCFHPTNTMINANHWVNHIDIAPNSKRFMFLHRWSNNSCKYHRLITANCFDGSDLFIVEGDKLISHSCWSINSDDIISFSINADSDSMYNLYKDKIGYVKPIKFTNTYGNIRDGHPSISPNGKWMITDEYPDKSNYSHLYIYNTLNHSTYQIGKFYQPYVFRGEKRIDLHPKWSPDGNYISIDSGHSGRREIYIIDIKMMLQKLENN